MQRIADLLTKGKALWINHDNAQRLGGKLLRIFDTIFGFDKEADALQWIKTKSPTWIYEQRGREK